MRQRRGSPRTQRGIALLGLLAVAVMVFAYVLTSRLNAASRFVAIDRDHNAKVMSQAKQALIGHMAQQAAMTGENNPGHLPCPEAPANFGTANEGIEAPFCSAQAIGRLPWRTLGLERLVDAAGEPLWYAVSGGWHRPSSTGTLTINSDSSGQLALDGVANDAVALIIAPGAAISAQACGGAAAWSQTRPVTGPPDLRNYLECENANTPADASFVSNRPGQTFNDQVLRVTAADVIPALEAAIQVRAQREIAPALRDAAFKLDSSSPRRWVSSTSNPAIYPYARPFEDPTTSNYRGAAGTYEGLLPFAAAAGFVNYQSNPTDAAEVFGNGYIYGVTCNMSGSMWLCQGRYHEDDIDPTLPMRLEMTATFTNVAMGLRTLDTTRMRLEARDNDTTGPWTVVTPSYRAEMNDGSVSGRPRGSVTIRFWANLPNIDVMGWESYADFRFFIEREVIADHCLLSTTATSCAGADTSWFARNQWHRNFYYAVARNNTANVLSSTTDCVQSGSESASNCLRFNDPATRKFRALLVLTGRALATQARPSNLVSNYLEYENNSDSGLVRLFEQRPSRRDRVSVPGMNAPWNDRVVLVDWVGSSPSFPVASLP